MRSLCLIVILFWCQLAFGQAKPGIYLTYNMELDICDHKMKMIRTEEVFCLSEEPLLEYDSFQRVDELEYDSLFEMRKFRIVLTKKAGDFVSTIASKLPGHHLALVVNGILVTLIDLDGIYNARSIMIWDQNDNDAIIWIHRSLVNEVTKNTRKS